MQLHMYVYMQDNEITHMLSAAVILCNADRYMRTDFPWTLNCTRNSRSITTEAYMSGITYILTECKKCIVQGGLERADKQMSGSSLTCLGMSDHMTLCKPLSPLILRGHNHSKGWGSQQQYRLLVWVCCSRQPSWPTLISCLKRPNGVMLRGVRQSVL